MSDKPRKNKNKGKKQFQRYDYFDAKKFTFHNDSERQREKRKMMKEIKENY